MNWRWISLAAALAAVVVGYGALVDKEAAPTTSQELPEQPGYYLKDAVILRTREDGSPGIELIVARVQQRLTRPSQGEAITMDSVRVNYFGKDDWQWALTAQHGEVPPNSRIVQLEGEVELRPLAGATANSFLRTDELAIDTEKNLAYSTHSPVQMQFGQHAMIAKSLRADLTSEKLRLETVNGRFNPVATPSKRVP